MEELFKKLQLFTFIICISFSTNYNNENENRPEILRCLNCSKKSKVKEQNLPYNDLKIIKLETSKECLIDGLQKIEFRDSLIFYLDLRESLFVFNTNGKFICKIGNKGQGPADFIKISTFFIDNQDRIVIVDDFKNVFLYFQFNGKFIESESIPREYITRSYNTYLTNDNQLLINRMISWRPEENMAYSFYDLNKKSFTKTDLTFNPITLDNRYQSIRNAMCNLGDEILFIMPLCDTVYSFSKSTVSSKYLIKTFDYKQIAKKQQITPQAKHYDHELFKLEQQGYFVGFNAIFETENYLLLEYAYLVLQYFLFDKRTKDGYHYMYVHEPPIREIPLFRIVHSLSGNQLVSVLDMDYIIKMLPELTGNNKYVNQLINILQGSEEDDNPIIMIYGY